MTREEYIHAIIRKTHFDRKTKKRLKADLESDIGARLDAGESLTAVMAAMGTPEEVAEGFAQSMGAGAVRKNPWRWVFLGFAVLMVLLVLYSAIAWQFYKPFVDTDRVLETMPPPSSVGIIGGADGPTEIFVTSVRFGIPGPAAIGWALASLAVFLLMQWKGVRCPTRFIVMGTVLLACAAFLLAGGLSGTMMESIVNRLMPLNAASVMLSRLVNPAFWGPLAVGVVSLRRGLAQRRAAKQA